MNNLLSKRFQELANQLEKVEATQKFVRSEFESSPRPHVDNHLLLNWVVKTKSLLVKACGVESQHFVHFTDAENGGAYRTNAENLQNMKAVFLAAREDFDGGYLNSLRGLVQAEVFDSELEQATELLRKSYKAPAAVIAGTVLETALRELCDRNQIIPGKLDKMNADLAKKGVYNLLMQKTDNSARAGSE